MAEDWPILTKTAKLVIAGNLKPLPALHDFFQTALQPGYTLILAFVLIKPCDEIH